MYNNFLRCAVFLLYFYDMALSFPTSNLFENRNIDEIETPSDVTFEVKTSLGSPSVVDLLTNGTNSNRFSIISRSDDESNIAGNVKPKQKDNVIVTKSSVQKEIIVTNTDTSVLRFDDDNSITDVNTEADSSTISNTEFTTGYTTTEDYESTTIDYHYDYEAVLRSEVSPAVFATLLG